MISSEIPTEILWSALGGAGGAVKVFYRWTKKAPINWSNGLWTLVLNIFISGFSGFLGAQLSNTITSDVNTHIIFAGIFGYLGVTGLDILAEKFNIK